LNPITKLVKEIIKRIRPTIKIITFKYNQISEKKKGMCKYEFNQQNTRFLEKIVGSARYQEIQKYSLRNMNKPPPIINIRKRIPARTEQ